MNGLSEYLVDSIIKEQTTALFGGGFKPPTKGHLEVILQGLKENPTVNKLIITVGKKVRDGITQDQSVQIWEIYKRLIPVETEIIPVSSPFNFYKTFLRENKEDKVYIFIGARKNNLNDKNDVTERSKFVKRYSDNVIPTQILTENSDSGTNSRNLLNQDLEGFLDTLPINLTEEEKLQVGVILDEKFINKLKNIKDKAKKFMGEFKKVVKREGKETGKLIGIIYKILVKNHKPTTEEKTFIKGQSLDLGRMTILTAIQLIPVPFLPTALTAGIVKLGKKYNFQVMPAPNMEGIKLTNKQFLNESSEDKFLYAFDLDDTLITSKSDIIVNNPERGTFRLTPAEYAIYEPGPNDEFDFSEFAQLINPRVIKDNFNKFSQILKRTSDIPNAQTIILTARQPEVAGDLEEFLDKKNLPMVRLHAVSSSDPNDKLKVIQDYINQGFNKIRFYDDSPKNISIVKSIKVPGVEISTKLIKNNHTPDSLEENKNIKFDYEPHIDSFNSYLIGKGENIEPLPKVSFITDDGENAEGISGKTAYYDPNQREVTLYTHSRHPKDVLRSLSHEYIHHKQNLEDRLGDITTDNTKEDDNLKKLESEAYTDGNINFREWTQTLNERRWTRSDSDVPSQDQHKYWAMYAHIFDHLKKGNVDIEDMEYQIKSDPNKSDKYKQESLNALYYFWKLIEDSEFDTEFGLHKER